MRHISNIVDLINVIFYPLKIFGLAPYIKVTDSLNQKGFLLSSTIFYFIYTLCICGFVTITCIVRMALEVKKYHVTFFDFIRACAYIMIQLGNILKLIEFAYEKKSFLHCLELTKQSDNILTKLGKTVTYKYEYNLLKYLTILCHVYLLATAWFLYNEIDKYGFFSKQTLKFLTVYLYSSFGYILYRRLHDINEFLIKVELEEPYVHISVKKGLKAAKKMHNVVTKLSQKMNRTFGWSTYITNFSFIVYFVALIVLRGRLLPQDIWGMVYFNTVCTSPALLILLYGERATYESNRLKRLLSDLTFPYFNKELSDYRREMHYQMMHESVELTAAGFYTLHTKTITSRNTVLQQIIHEPIGITAADFYVLEHQTITGSDLKADQIEDGSYELIQVTGRRWLILILFVVSCGLNNMQWIQYSVIADVVVKHYNISYNAVNWTSMVFLLLYGIFLLPGIYVSQKFGLRRSILLNTTLTCLGSWIKVFSVEQDKFWVVLFGQSVVAISAVFIVSAPASIAATWFGSTQVSFACSVGINGVMAGVAIGCLIPTLTVSNLEYFQKNLYIMLLSIAIITTLVFILQLKYFDDKPLHPPSIAQLQQRIKPQKSTSFLKSISNLLKNASYLFHLIGFSITYGILCSVLGLLSQFISSCYENASVDAGRIGLVLIVTGITGSVLCGILLDKFNKYKSIYIFLQFGCVVSMILFTNTLGTNIIITYIASGLLGLFIISTQPVASESAIEFTYPELEGIVVGLLFGSGQIFGMAITYLHSELLYTFGVVFANNCASLSLLFVLIVIIFIPFKYNRYGVNFSTNLRIGCVKPPR
ncbi:hypothetical protein FQR65_LT11478 [Abscondita terminalis]|nr:hypothetical protein FQR65_LT11478 [Abscondita terminalis]